MSNIAIKLENISKQYRLGVVGTGTLSHDLNRWWAKVRGKEDPTLKIGQENTLAKEGGDYVWALKNINLEIKQGEVLGIMGKNGAGKSTLLKLLSRVTGPTTGQIKIKGRIASLLEVGTGFHPELTGRENIFLNGAILGMRKGEIRKKLDEIVDFAGVAKYLDTPVKRYSSGMYVRLAFAVAAHLEPDILVVDEVLAVGDAEFQKKAIGKMQDVSKGGGRTVLFVSHNMASIQQLCSRAVVLQSGSVFFNGNVKSAVEKYLLQNINYFNSKGRYDFTNQKIGDDKFLLQEITVSDSKNKIRTLFLQEEEIVIKIKFKLFSFIAGMRINLWIKTVSGIIAFGTSSHELTKDRLDKGIYKIKAIIPPGLLNTGRYILGINIGIPGVKFLVKNFDFGFVDIESGAVHGSAYSEKWEGIVAPKIDWLYEEVS